MNGERMAVKVEIRLTFFDADKDPVVQELSYSDPLHFQLDQNRDEGLVSTTLHLVSRNRRGT